MNHRRVRAGGRVGIGGRRRSRLAVVGALGGWLCAGGELGGAGDAASDTRPAAGIWFELRCVDARTGRGVPMVELVTVNHLRYVTDNQGRVAFHEPGLMGEQEVFFHVRSPGYALPKDGFGYSGVRARPRPGGRLDIRLDRVNLAERLYRITGEGRDRDSRLLGYVTADAAGGGTARGLVAGQDSVQADRYRGRIHWFWGDTDRMSYPLGHFRTSGATSPSPGAGARSTAEDLDLTYFVGREGFSRPMLPLPERPEGVIWIDGLAVVPDDQGRERMVCHYSRRKGLEEELEHGLAVFNDDKAIFETVRQLPETERWRFLHGHTTRVEEDGALWLYCGLPLLHVRVPARFEAVTDPARYESFTCLEAGQDPRKAMPRRGAGGGLDWRWSRDVAPAGPAEEARWCQGGQMRPEEARFSPRSSTGPERPVIHGGTVRWNAFRQRWMVIGVQSGGGSSYLGEVWYSEGRSPVGPFERAVKVVTHDRQSFYNPCHHDFLDEAGGRFVYFEGTYVNTFSGNPDATPRYNYNQILYRLDLADPRLVE